MTFLLSSWAAAKQLFANKFRKEKRRRRRTKDLVTVADQFLLPRSPRATTAGRDQWERQREWN